MKLDELEVPDVLHGLGMRCFMTERRCVVSGLRVVADLELEIRPARKSVWVSFMIGEAAPEVPEPVLELCSGLLFELVEKAGAAGMLRS